MAREAFESLAEWLAFAKGTSAPQFSWDEPVPDAGVRSCPVCRRAMTTYRPRGVAVDVCDEHGIWFDWSELQAVLSG